MTDRERLAELLKGARFEPDWNICATCHHLGGDHDLSNKCLICGDYFASMNEAQQWEHGIDLLLAAGFTFRPAATPSLKGATATTNAQGYVTSIEDHHA